MPRTPRSGLVTDDGVYHVIVRGNNRMHVFHGADDYEAYADLLLAAKGMFGVVIYHYVLMPNHAHLLVGKAERLSMFMQWVQGTYSKRHHRLYKRVGHTWQGRYKSLPIGSDAYLFACGNYIEMNPVRAALARTPEEWKHSSYKIYAFGERDRLVTIDPFYATLGRTSEDRQKAYRQSIALTRAV